MKKGLRKRVNTIFTVNNGRLQRLYDLFLYFFVKIPIGCIQALSYLINERPDAVLSFGGYGHYP
jgi:UDP-N-acetylglucosamine:LPS N-acetylglucosamine transferase